jgi:hypothetical protein
MQGKRYAILFRVFRFNFTYEIHILSALTPVTGSGFLRANTTGAACGDNDGATIHFPVVLLKPFEFQHLPRVSYDVVEQHMA